MKFRTLIDNGGDAVTDVVAFDAQAAAEACAEEAFNKEPHSGCMVYVQDEDGEVCAFDVEVEMVPSFDATENDDAVPAAVRAAFGRTS